MSASSRRRLRAQGLGGSYDLLRWTRIGDINLMWGRLSSRPVPRTFQSGVPTGDWKVARTGGQECPPYTKRFMVSLHDLEIAHGDHEP
ncbi:MAG: hypothetical protein KIS67_19135, partial [Verrucomicrobiae bacterium]|nr:hypothetical protein [Verrucomicrobiae bacterium]